MPYTTEQPTPADLLRASQRFRDWNPEPSRVRKPGVEVSNLVAEKHYSPSELAELWGVSPQTIRDLFKDEDGVLKLGSDGTKTRRADKTLRIPHSVAERVHTRLSC